MFKKDVWKKFGKFLTKSTVWWSLARLKRSVIIGCIFGIGTKFIPPDSVSTMACIVIGGFATSLFYIIRAIYVRKILKDHF